MKNMPLTGLLLSAVLITSCGKEAATGKAQDKTVVTEVTASERLFNAGLELRRAVKDNDTVTLRRVIFENPDLTLDKRYEDGYTLLTYAIKNRFTVISNVLLEKGASPHLQCLNIDYPGFTPLMLAAYTGNTAAVSSLLEKGAQINAQDELGDTALHKAIKNGYDEAAKLLIQSGADIQIENDRQESPLETARSLGRKDISELLNGLTNLEMGAPTIAVFRRILSDGDIVNYRKLVALHPEVIPEYSEINPLALLVESTNEINAFEIAQSLLAQRVSVDGPSDSETTPVIAAVKTGKSNFTELYLQKSPDLQKLDKDDKPALYYAIVNNDEKLVDLLMNSGALEKFDATNRRGKKVYFRACKSADANERYLDTYEEQLINRRIQSRLGCRWPR